MYSLMNREEPDKFSFPGLVDRSKPAAVVEPPKQEEKKEEPVEKPKKAGRPKKQVSEDAPVGNKVSLKLGKIKY
jgi:hypothetical protein